MFKRVDKRRRRQEEEEELGLDSEMKQVLGLQDTDSEESDSDSDDGGSSDGEGMDFEGFGGSDDEEDEEGESGEEEYDSDGSVQVDAKNYPASALSLTVKQVLADSIIPAPEDPILNFCILCPQKTLRNASMVQAHKRRLNQFKKHAKGADPEDDALDIIEEHMSGDPEPFVQPHTAESEAGKSKRALKKEKSRAVRKEKRQQAKAKAYAKKQAAPTDPKPITSQGTSEQATKSSKAKSAKTSKVEDVEEPSTKKRRVDKTVEPPAKEKAEKAGGETKPRKKGDAEKKAKAPKTSEALSPPEVKVKAAGSTPSIKNIARSATSRAKAALAQSRKSRSS